MDTGQLEGLIAQQFRLEGEDVVRISTGHKVDNKPDTLGYIRTSVSLGGKAKRSVSLHRVKFFLLHGWLPEKVDHRDRTPGNNATDNLRAATHQQNMLNRNPFSNRTLPRGVYKAARGRGYYAAATFHKVRYHLGYHATIQSAADAVEAFRRQHHGEFYAEAQSD